ncbi:MAG: cytochrome c biogenesis protein ResB [Verrucomicrobia bacterium]|nr:cytochrome c biogenesis protein ResB [Verrucomicrobiota bacterium]
MLRKLFDIFSSLKLTVVLLSLSCVLVFLGTMAQDPLGLYLVQHRFFQSLFVDYVSMSAAVKKTLQMLHIYVTPTTAADVMAAPYVPVFPGGYLLGWALLVNLVTAHFRYFKATKKKIGIALIHSGVVLLLLGQFATDLLQVESHMRLTEGETKFFSESSRQSELAIVDTTQPDRDQVVAIPVSRLSGTFQHETLPFSVEVKAVFQNATPEFVTTANDPAAASQGVGPRLKFRQEPPVTRLDSRDVPAALVELRDGEKSLGTWWVSNWLAEEPLRRLILQQSGPAVREALARPQSFTHAGRTFELAMRPMRFYEPHSLTLLEFRHDKYKGTEIPKNFSSRVRVQRPDTGEDREVLIYMNNPLRYAGKTYYQSGYDDKDPRVTILQVVRNPGWLTPYLACVIVSVGLCLQFGMHLLEFARKRQTS